MWELFLRAVAILSATVKVFSLIFLSPLAVPALPGVRKAVAGDRTAPPAAEKVRRKCRGGKSPFVFSPLSFFSKTGHYRMVK
jgi:hypothetical protein